MHLRNSITRSTSSWKISQLPSSLSGLRGWKAAMFSFTR